MATPMFAGKGNVISVSLEGGDGTGKATQTERLVKWLQSCGLRVGRVSFPRYSETFSGRMLFDFLKSEHADIYDFAHANPYVASRIYAQDRLESRDHLNSLYANNDVVVFDRYVESNLLHQGGKFKTREEKVSFAEWLFGLEYGEHHLPKPDLVIYLDLPPIYSFERSKKRAEMNEEKQDSVESSREYVENSYEAGKVYAQMFGWKVVECISREDNYSNELTIEKVHEQVIGVVREVFSLQNC